MSGIWCECPPTHVLHRNCETMKRGDWEDVLKTAQKGTAIFFLIYLRGEYEISSDGIGWQYFRQWKQYTSTSICLNWCRSLLYLSTFGI